MRFKQYLIQESVTMGINVRNESEVKSKGIVSRKVDIKEISSNTPNPQLVIELFTKPVSFSMEGSNREKTTYVFTIKDKTGEGNDKEYHVYLWKEDTPNVNVYEVIFELVWVGKEKIYLHGREEITGSGDAIEVFSTIGAILKDFAKQKSPDAIKFSAKEPSRIKLYKTLSRHIASKSYLKATTTIKDRNTIFINARNSETLKEIEDWLENN